MVRYARFKKTFVEATPFHEYMKEDQKEERDSKSKSRRKLEKRMVCFGCRKSGHALADCPVAAKPQDNESAACCYRCGSKDHSLSGCPVKKRRGDELPFAECFVCKEKGHLASKCPTSKAGIYPNGGCCHLCQSVMHLAMNCPTKQNGTDDMKSTPVPSKKKKVKVVQF